MGEGRGGGEMLEVGTLPRITPIPSFPSRRGRREAAGTRRGRPSGCRGGALPSRPGRLMVLSAPLRRSPN